MKVADALRLEGGRTQQEANKMIAILVAVTFLAAVAIDHMTLTHRAA